MSELTLCLHIIQLFHFMITRWRSRWRSEQFGPVCCSGGGHGPGRPRNPITEHSHYKHLAWSWGDTTTPWWAPPHTYSTRCWTTSVQGPHSSICKLDSTARNSQFRYIQLISEQAGVEVMVQACVWEALSSSLNLATSAEVFSCFSSVPPGRCWVCSFKWK